MTGQGFSQLTWGFEAGFFISPPACELYGSGDFLPLGVIGIFGSDPVQAIARLLCFACLGGKQIGEGELGFEWRQFGDIQIEVLPLKITKVS